MKKTILSLAAVAVISGAAGTNAHAENVKVQSGDTLWGLSAKYEVSINDIKSWNNLTSEIIYPNDLLKISREETYTIKQGDTLSHIATIYGVTVNEIKEWNTLSSDLIHPNDRLSIMTNQSADTSESQQPTQAAKQESVPEETEEPTAPVAEQESVPEETEEPAAPQTEQPVESSESESATGEGLSVSATGYTASCEGCTGVTATGIDLNANPEAKVIAVDPNVIPLGSKVYVEGYGYATADDTGGAIKGNKIDLFFADEQDALNWGVKQVNVKVIK